jgi:hypothetical protein
MFFLLQQRRLASSLKPRDPLVIFAVTFVDIFGLPKDIQEILILPKKTRQCMLQVS